MRRILAISVASAALLATGLLAPTGAQAMLIAPEGLSAAVGGASLVQDAAYGCRPVWRCGYGGCGWRSACGWRPGPRWGYGYGYYGPYRPRPWAAWGWRHRYW